MLGVTYKTAWFMAHRIRFAMTPNPLAEPKLKGTVEVDETFVGGKGDGRTRFTRQSPVWSRWSSAAAFGPECKW